jgi:RNA polymerase sigma-70 factor, ECF subfamily
MSRSKNVSIRRGTRALCVSRRTGRKGLRVILQAMLGNLLKTSGLGAGSQESLLHQTLEEAIRQFPHWLKGIAFSCEFCLQYRKNVLAVIRRKIRCRTIADDLVQETFLRALQAVRSGKRLPKRRKAWLFTIARNVVNDQFRKQRRRKEVCLPELDDAGVFARSARPMNEAKDMAECLGILEQLAGKDLAELVRLRLNGLTNEEIAKAKGVDERTIERRWRRLREIVKKSPAFSSIFI